MTALMIILGNFFTDYCGFKETKAGPEAGSVNGMNNINCETSGSAHKTLMQDIQVYEGKYGNFLRFILLGKTVKSNFLEK